MDNDWSRGRIGARPKTAGTTTAPRAQPGFSPLGLGARDGVLYVPKSHDAKRPAPLIVMLHGAGGAGARAARMLQSFADRDGMLLLAPDSLGQTWDLLERNTGPDVERIDSALESLFDRFAIDDKHLAIAGFSDGASYALTLGVANGDLFTHVLAFSPGFLAATAQVGEPRFFVSHGRADNVLPIAQCSRRLVPQLKRAGYDVDYREFEGGHTVPSDIADDAIAWFLA